MLNEWKNGFECENVLHNLNTWNLNIVNNGSFHCIFKQLKIPWTELNDYCVELLNFPIRFPPPIPYTIYSNILWTSCKFAWLLVLPILKSSLPFLQVYILCVSDVNYVRYRVFLLFSFWYLLLFRVYFNSFHCASKDKMEKSWKMEIYCCAMDLTWHQCLCR